MKETKKFSYKARTKSQWKALRKILYSMGLEVTWPPPPVLKPKYERYPWFNVTTCAEKSSYYTGQEKGDNYEELDDFADFVSLTAGYTPPPPPEDPGIKWIRFRPNGMEVVVGADPFQGLIVLSCEDVEKIREHMQALREYHRTNREN